MYKFKFPKVFQPFRCDNIIRIGKNNDGGYLINENDVYNTNTLLSIGIGEDISFEKAFTSLNDCALYAYDKVVAADLQKFFVGNKHLIMQNISKNNFDSILIGEKIFLKCDIEGAEYDLLDTIIKYSDKFTGMAIEFHDINNGNNFDSLTNFISKIKHKLIHTHVNNYFYYISEEQRIPDIIELSFTSSDNIVYDPNLELPNIMDMPNNPKDKEFNIVFK